MLECSKRNSNNVHNMATATTGLPVFPNIVGQRHSLSLCSLHPTVATQHYLHSSADLTCLNDFAIIIIIIIIIISAYYNEKLATKQKNIVNIISTMMLHGRT